TNTCPLVDHEIHVIIRCFPRGPGKITYSCSKIFETLPIFLPSSLTTKAPLPLLRILQIINAPSTSTFGSISFQVWTTSVWTGPRPTETDRDRPRPTDFGPSRVEPIVSVRLGPYVFPGPIGPKFL